MMSYILCGTVAAAAIAAPTTRPGAIVPVATQPAVDLQSITLADATGATVHPLNDQQSRAIVLLFVAVDCPISNGYAPELKRLIADAGPRGFTFRLVYADAAQTPAAVRAHQLAFGLDAPAVLDPQHVLVNAVSATVTPEAAIVQAGRIVYLGRIDNRWGDFGLQRPAATVHDLADALDAIVAGRPIEPAVIPAVGCPM